MYQEEDLVRIAKRENNTKRNYLVVNQLQGKHIPVSSHKAFAMFEELAEQLRNAYGTEKLLLVGFAETATAIGAAVAVLLGQWYMQTTREPIPNVEYLFFSESHSHATEQKLVKNDIDSVIDQVERIIFVEDEVTTGNTILHIIDLLEETYQRKFKFAVASILNGMDIKAKEIYDQRGIPCHYLVKTNHTPYAKKAETYTEDGNYQKMLGTEENSYAEIELSGWKDARRLVDAKEYKVACVDLWKQMKEQIDFSNQAHILVLGTEECMYPALYVAGQLEDLGKEVRCHSTTRSPIAVSKANEYPLHTRYQLESLYDRERKTFIYDIGKYDAVIIVTDAHIPGAERTLIEAVTKAGNTNITLVRWK